MTMFYKQNIYYANPGPGFIFIHLISLLSYIKHAYTLTVNNKPCSLETNGPISV